jgi:hypothetical protein
LSLFNRCEETRERTVCVKIVVASAIAGHLFIKTPKITRSLAVTTGKSAGKQIAISATSTLTVSRSVLKLAIAQQPRMDNSPLVASPRLKIQQWRPRIL